MKRATATLLGLLILVFGALAQMPAKAKKGVPTVSLDTILSCSNDIYVQHVFKTELGTMHKLGMGAMIVGHVKDKTDDASVALRYAGFQSGFSNDPLVMSVMPFRPDGTVISPAPFCSILDVNYEKASDDSLPYMVSIYVDSDYWVFNPNELFLHADQFTFRSGVFNDSSKVFLAATKGRVEIQFVAEPNGLTLYRVFIKADKLLTPN